MNETLGEIVGYRDNFKKRHGREYRGSDKSIFHFIRAVEDEASEAQDILIEYLMRQEDKNLERGLNG